MKLSTWAKINGLDYQTAWHLFKNGNLPVKAIQLKTGTILIKEDQPMVDDKTVIYCRVSNHSRKKELEYQVDRCNQFCLSNGWSINSAYKEIASGMNGNRKMLNKILDNPPSKLVVLHKDRLTRFGFNYLSKLLKHSNCDVVVINNSNGCDNDDILKDFIAIITSFCCRLYGARRGQSKSLKLKEELIK